MAEGMQRTGSMANDGAEAKRIAAEKEWTEKLCAHLDSVKSFQEAHDPKTELKTIFRARRHVRKANLDHFIPEHMYLGLLHKNRFAKDVHEKKADKLRIKLVRAFIRRVKQSDPDASWERVRQKVVPDPEAMQKLYELDIHEHRDPDIVQIALTYDAVFLVSYMGGLWLRPPPRLDNKPGPFSVFADIVSEEGQHFHTVVTNDIIKLENQVPLQLVLRALGVLFSGEDKNTWRELDVLNAMCWALVRRIASSLPGFQPKTSPFKLKADNLPDCKHLLAYVCLVMKGRSDPEAGEVLEDLENQVPSNDRLALKCFLPFRKAVEWWEEARERTSGGEDLDLLSTNISLPSAVKLREAGIHISGDCRGTGDLVPKFNSGFVTASLYIPTLSVVHRTEALWRNMVAYEVEMVQEGNHGSAQFVYFLKFMDELVNSDQDVLLLRDGSHPVFKKNLLGSEKDVALLVNSVVQNYPVVDAGAKKWAALRKDIDDFCNQRYRIIVLEFIRTYFGKPWLVISLVAATVLLVLTFLQTVYTLLAFYP